MLVLQSASLLGATICPRARQLEKQSTYRHKHRRSWTRLPHLRFLPAWAAGGQDCPDFIHKGWLIVVHTRETAPRLEFPISQLSALLSPARRVPRFAPAARDHGRVVERRSVGRAIAATQRRRAVRNALI